MRELSKTRENKILLLTTSFPKDENDTSSLFIYTLADYLSINNKVDVLCPAADNIPIKQKIKNVNVIRFNYFLPGLQKLAYGIPEKYKRHWIQIPFLFLSFLFNAIKIGRKYNAINAHWLIPSGLIGAIMKVIYKKKFVLTVHSTDILLMRKIPFSKSLTNFIVKNADAVFIISNKSKNNLLKLCKKEYINKMIVMPMGINLEYKKINKVRLRKKYGIKTNKVVMYIGRLVKIKGVDYLIKSLNGLNNITLIIAGEGPELSNLKELANNLKVNAQFVGQINGQTKKDYFDCSDLIVIPSIKLKDGRYDGLPTVALEALSLGIPVISSNATSLGEIIRNNYNGFLFEEKDHLQLRSLIKNYFNKKPAIIKKNAYASSEKFHIKNIGKYYNNLLN